MKLNEEQKMIATLVVKGRSNLQIALATGYSVSSIKRRLKNMYKIYKTDNRWGFISKFIIESN